MTSPRDVVVSIDPLGRVVERAVEVMDQRHEVQLLNVPENQMRPLRSALRSEARRRGWTFQSFLVGTDALIACTPGRWTDAEMQALMRRAVERGASGSPIPPDERTRFDWVELL